MKYFTRVLLLVSVTLLTFIQSQAQEVLQGRVTDKKTGEPLSFVTIYLKGSGKGLYSDVQGQFSLRVNPNDSILVLSYIGYEKQEIRFTPGKILYVKLSPDGYQLAELKVKPGKYRSDWIMEQVVKNRSENSLEGQPTYQYRAYHRFEVGLNAKTDTLSIDSTIMDGGLDTLLHKMHLFLIESVTERKFRKPDLMNEVVLANRVSGLKKTQFTLLGTQLQSFDFYQDQFTLLGKQYLSPITKNNTKFYVFELEDSLDINGRKTFIIQYYPRKKMQFQGLNGLIYVDAENFGIQRITASGNESRESGKLQVTQVYTLNKNNLFIPDYFSAEFDMSNVSVQTDSVNGSSQHITPKAVSQTRFFNVIVGEQIPRKEFSSLSLSYSKNYKKNNDSLFGIYRYEPPTAKDSLTYMMLDSLFEEAKLERKLTLMKAFFYKRLPLGPYLELDLNKVIRVNRYEDLRLGAGLYTSESVSKWFTLGGYYGYGFGDKAHKYGGEATIWLNRRTGLSLFGAYDNEVYETGAVEYAFFSAATLENYRLLQIKVMDHRERWRAAFRFRAFKYGQVQVGITDVNDEYKAGYYYRDSSQTGFRSTYAEVGLRYSFREKRIEMMDMQVNMNTPYPILYLNIQQGIRSSAVIPENFTRIAGRAEHKFFIRPNGEFNWCFEGGWASSTMPAPLLFTGKANTVAKGLSITSKYSFETMRMNEFLSDAYGSLFLWYHVGKILRKPIGKFNPSWSLIHNALWSSLQDPQNHIGVGTKDAQRLFTEGAWQ